MGTTGFEVMEAIVEAKGTADYTMNCNTTGCGVDVYQIKHEYDDSSRIEVWHDYGCYTFWALYVGEEYRPRCAYVKTWKNVFVEIETYDFDDITTAIMNIINAADECDDDLLADYVTPELYKVLDDWHDKLHEVYL